MRNKKFIGLFESVLVLLSVFAFSYLISTDSIPLASAQEARFYGCCLETVQGAICQEIPIAQSDLCKDSLIGTGCTVVDQCKLGCCYSADTGTCATRAPKDKCISNGGNWSSDASCNIPQCQLGCCVMGDQVSLTNSRECTLLSNKFNFEKSFIQVSPGEGCDKYVGLEKRGACLTDSGDYSGENKCTFTTKKNCRGDFKEDYLCTSEELKTICQKSKKTTCVDGKDQVYFLDTCGNVANVYDASKVNDQSYWEKVITPEDSCSPENPSCGNCNYGLGSICVEHEPGETIRPTYGDYTCKSLHCGERKHGESWCIYDYSPLSGISPVGSRHFIAKCFEGDISIEGCADFGQEICAQSTDTSFGFTEAKCFMNDWRACLNANDADSYSNVKTKCEESPQCIMFNDLYGEDKLKRNDGEFLVGFDPDKLNSEQGAIGDFGEELNEMISHCVPRFTPGFQFWASSVNPLSGANTSSVSTTSYGGSKAETDAICSIGSFSCISNLKRECAMSDSGDFVSTNLCLSTGGISALASDPDCDPWEDVENWECNIDGKTITINTTDLPALMSAMNERCRALGSCGVAPNLQGELREDMGFTITRAKIDATGENENVSVDGYILSSDYVSNLKSQKTYPINTLDELKTTTIAGLSGEQADATSSDFSGSERGAISLQDVLAGADLGDSSSGLEKVVGIVGPITLTLATMFYKELVTVAATQAAPVIFSSLPFQVPQVTIALAPAAAPSVASAAPGTLSGLQSAGIMVAATIIGSFLGMGLGKLIVANQDWSPGRVNVFMQGIMAAGAMAGAAIAGTTLLIIGTSASFGPIGIIAGIIIAALMSVYKNCVDNEYEEYEYYIMDFTCESWQPPQGGDCSVCNNDVRPCSEYRCKSLGSNCHYFVENGEPGTCASLAEIWSAQITPWQDILTSGNQYTSVQRNGFKIQGSLGQGVEAWTSLTFGIITDKSAQCKIDFEHTTSFSEMKYEMSSPINPETGKADATHHFIELNPFTGKNGSTTTMGLVQGEENEYYIRCMNFAGQLNEAEFVVQIRAKEGPDLTPADLRRFYPETNSYLKQGTNSTEVILYLNEPAECRFDYEYDALSGSEGYDELRHKMFCSTDKSSAFFGEWRCFANLENLTEGLNNLYFRCKDQPDLEETENYPRNTNLASKNYKLNVCSNGLEISLLNTDRLIEEKNFTLSVSTSGCLGDAVCSFRMQNYSSLYSNFFETGKRVHSQLLMLPQGEHLIDVMCEDESGNIANQTFKFTVYFDDVPPQILRVLNLDGNINLITDEDAECMYGTNKSIACGFDFNSNTLSYLSKEHKFKSNPLEMYFIRCRDKKLNVVQSCSAIIKSINTN